MWYNIVAMSNQIQRKCPICDKTYFADVSRLKWGRETTCSRRCSYLLRAKKLNKSQKIDCPICGKEFIAVPSRIKRAKYTPVCSRDCLYKGRSLGIIKREVKEPYRITLFGKQAWQKAAVQRRGRPRKQRPAVKFTCEICSKIVSVPHSKIGARKFRFCSPKCVRLGLSGTGNPAWRGGHEKYYGPNWRSQRRAARKRDGYICQRCGKTTKEAKRSLDVHHRISFNQFESYKEANRLANLITLCHACHQYIEWHGIDF